MKGIKTTITVKISVLKNISAEYSFSSCSGVSYTFAAVPRRASEFFFFSVGKRNVRSIFSMEAI